MTRSPEEVDTELSILRKRVEALEAFKVEVSTGRKIFLWLVAGLGWAILVIVGAMKNWHQ